MLADTDAGSVTTVAQSGAQWGYHLLLPNLLLIPFMFVAQELALRLGLGTRRGLAELVLQRFGWIMAVLLLGILGLSCSGALVSQLSGLAGAGQALGVPVWVTMTATISGLIIILFTGSYRSVQRVALLVGLFELAFLVMAWRAAPGLAPIVQQATHLPLYDHDYLYLLAANLGTSIIPWTLMYQQSASVDKGLGPGQVRSARLETLIGVILCQTITSALLIAAAAMLGKGQPLNTVAEIETAFTATLGAATGHVIFVLGLSGSALVATIVVCLTLAWTVGDVLGVRHSLEHRPKDAPWFYGSLTLMLAAGGALVASGVNLVQLSVAAGVLNALLLPVVLGFLYLLARSVLPDSLRLKGIYAAVAAVAFLVAGAVGIYAGAAGLV
ncbi:MAG: divalent metal cation transporter [Alphaproteobacteria bacterium]|nr:divalent metal cation transporter [Alphaproteobacteria bacterium]